MVGVVERIMQRVVADGDCLIYMGSRDSWGYGYLYANGRSRGAHRLMLESVVGELRRDQFACHTCDRPACVNPAHLFVGSSADNMRDMAAKGRGGNQRKRSCPRVTPTPVTTSRSNVGTDAVAAPAPGRSRAGTSSASGFSALSGATGDRPRAPRRAVLRPRPLWRPRVRRRRRRRCRPVRAEAPGVVVVMCGGCQMGLSAQAIASGGRDHPWDPSDLLRCVRYCRAHSIDTDELRRRMAGLSVQWDRLLAEWDDLVALLDHEVATSTDGMAPRTYMAMQRVLAGGEPCAACDSTGRGAVCVKCKGTGRRSGGRCRAAACYRGAAPCPACRGAGHVRPKAVAS